MSRPRKGARLYLRKGRVDRRTGRALPDIYFIRDGEVEISTGCPPDCLQQAEIELAAYIVGKAAPPVVDASAALRRGDSAEVLVTEVLTYYAEERAPELDSDAKTIAGFIAKLGEFWGDGDKTVADVKRSTCKDYVAWRTAQAHGSFTKNPTDRKVSDQTARRELEELSSAIGFWDGEYKLDKRPSVWLPEKRESQRDAMTRSQAAALLWAAMGWRLRTDEDPAGSKWIRRRQVDITNRRHIRRYALIGFYTGTRSKVITTLLSEEAALQPWTDLDHGMIYRRGREERERFNKKRPVVRIPDRLLTHMRRWRRMDQALEEQRRKGDEAKGIKPDSDFRLVAVIHFNGEPIVGRPRTAFEACVADAGLPAEITPHWLRHTCATWLMQGGADIWDASAYTGMTPTMLEKNYGHHHPDFQNAARRAIGGRRRAPALKVVSGEHSG